jgi:hypothetical protein
VIVLELGGGTFGSEPYQLRRLHHRLALLLISGGVRRQAAWASRRYRPGGCPRWRENARLNAYSEV